ncbi:hypothetical protein PE066_04410 [Ramlibacter tataouinensis]|uniref:hypothetical protein n=1 Tax=Ramlibacter tataouinensis TaxID=94132 RepID=UPI0022F3A3F7|nr:hypothetical protein [Ramlibacter tataouinensis]WBY02788.1 hypothetical protein PE066_04410 [Ramlibacter tataouinensis]
MRDRSEELKQLHAQSGLADVLQCEWVKPLANIRRTKLLLQAKNHFGVRSVEIVEPKSQPAYLRIYYRRPLPWVKEAVESTPGARVRSSDDHGTNLDGDFMSIVSHLARTLRKGRVA